MTTYHTAEQALVDLVQSYNDGETFNATNSGADYWRALDSNGTEYAAIIEMGAASKEGDNLSAFGNEVKYGGYGAQGIFNEAHTFDLWLCVKRGQGAGGDAKSKADIKVLTESVKDYLRPYRTLNIGAPVVETMIVSTSAPSGIAPKSKPTESTHTSQVITIRVLCESDTPEEVGP